MKKLDKATIITLVLALLLICGGIWRAVVLITTPRLSELTIYCEPATASRAVAAGALADGLEQGIGNISVTVSGEDTGAPLRLIPATQAEKEYEASGALRVIAALYYEVNHVIAYDGDAVESFEQLDGKPVRAFTDSAMDELVSHANATGVDCTAGLDADGSVCDTGLCGAVGAWVLDVIGAGKATELLETGARLLPVSGDMAALAVEGEACREICVIPAGTYPGQNGDVETTAVRLLLVAGADMDEDTAHAVAGAIWNNIDLIGERCPVMAGVHVADAVFEGGGLPLHDGAAKFYMEAGVLTR